MTARATKRIAPPAVERLWDRRELRRLIALAVNRTSRTRINPRAVWIERAWPVGESAFRFQWSFEIGSGRRRSLYAVPLTRRDTTEPSNTNAGRRRDAARGVWCPVPEYQLLIHSPDRDRGMPQMRTCLDSNAMLARLQKHASGRRAWDRVRCDLVGFKPGRRAAIRYDCRNGSASHSARFIAKSHHRRPAPDSAAMLARLREGLRSETRGRVDVPRAVEYCDDIHTTLFAWQPGRGAADGKGLTPRRAREAMQALAALHRVELAGLGTFSVEQELKIARRWLSALRLARPELADRGAALLGRLDRLSKTIDARLCTTIHRDFYEKQLIWSKNHIAILDLDTLVRGHPALDLGNFLAHYYLHRLHSGVTARQFGETALALCDAYEHAGGRIIRTAAAFYCASALVRGGALHALRTTTQHFSARLWRLADAILTEPNCFDARSVSRKAGRGGRVRKGNS